MAGTVKIHEWFRTIYTETADWTRGFKTSNVTIYADEMDVEIFGVDYVVVHHVAGESATEVYRGEDLEAAQAAAQAKLKEVNHRVFLGSRGDNDAILQHVTAGKIVLPLQG